MEMLDRRSTRTAPHEIQLTENTFAVAASNGSMFLRPKPKLLFLVPPALGVTFWLFMDGVFGNETGSWAGVGMLLAFGGSFPLLGVVSRLEAKLEEADYARRLAPVKESVEACWLMEGKENDYRHLLVKQLFHTLNVVAKPDAPLPTGTKVDAYMEFGKEDWYITIKRGINNQKRLILQGEIEDIIVHAPRRNRDLWIYVVVGITDREDYQELSHLRQLCEYAGFRSALHHRGIHTGEEEPRVNIEVMAAVIPSEPLEDDDVPASPDLVTA
ncbi:hypothetical protein ENSA5_39760 [Enhygromyxa salina]|uniref:Uncharacterized protein n=1 Tax=Enhygromyxa salina TaxID=215803 RepID=A0A2S9XRR6_9BACT|nr:hypothetical protein [Enhygromyxa salina]PRP95391.1 hypothetical protein ENSA5_39760 [Enhygromyxa salina]